MAISMSEPSPRSMSSVSSSMSMFSWAMSWSSISWMRGSIAESQGQARPAGLVGGSGGGAAGGAPPQSLLIGSSGEGDPGGLEDVLGAIAADGAEAPVLESEETVEGARSNEMGHLELPAEAARGRFLVPLDSAADVGHIPDQVEHAHGAFGAPKPQHHLVGLALAERLHRHLARLEQVRRGLRHGGPEEVARGGVRVVEVPAPGGEHPDLGVLPEGGRDAATALDEHGTSRAQLGQTDARAREPEL